MTGLQPHVGAFRERGWCLLDGLLAAEAGRLQRETDALVERARGRAESDAHFDFEPSHRVDDMRLRRIRRPDELSDYFHALARHPALLEAVSALLGPNVRLHHSKINLKSPRYGSPVEWHQDWHFIPHSNMDLAIAAIMIDPCTPENGPMLMLSGSHLGPLHDHGVDGIFYGAIDMARAGLDAAAAVPAVGCAGSISLHHPMTVHGSDLNRSGEPRRLLFYEYAAADAWPLFYGVEFEDYDARMVLGKTSYTPRLEPVHVRMPYPQMVKGAIYAQQERFPSKFFAHYREED